MLTELCAVLHNYFEVPNGRHFGEFKISGGSIEPLDFLKNGQYIRIIGSVFNDGVHQYPTDNLTDEIFSGAVWVMAVPEDVKELNDEIKAYISNSANQASPYVSESFGGYTYTKAVDENNAPLSWVKIFDDRLRRYKKI